MLTCISVCIKVQLRVMQTMSTQKVDCMVMRIRVVSAHCKKRVRVTHSLYLMHLALMYICINCIHLAINWFCFWDKLSGFSLQERKQSCGGSLPFTLKENTAKLGKGFCSPSAVLLRLMLDFDEQKYSMYKTGKKKALFPLRPHCFWTDFIGTVYQIQWPDKTLQANLHFSAAEKRECHLQKVLVFYRFITLHRLIYQPCIN